MRTTLDLPDEMLRKAKIAAVERRSTLRQLVIEALRREMESPLENLVLPQNLWVAGVFSRGFPGWCKKVMRSHLDPMKA